MLRAQHVVRYENQCTDIKIFGSKYTNCLISARLPHVVFFPLKREKIRSLFNFKNNLIIAYHCYLHRITNDGVGDGQFCTRMLSTHYTAQNKSLK